MSASKERICKVSGESSCSAGSSEQEAHRGTWNPERHLLSQNRLVKIFNCELIATCTVALQAIQYIAGKNDGFFPLYHSSYFLIANIPKMPHCTYSTLSYNFHFLQRERL